MVKLARESCRYTPLFCEENVWWLARRLIDDGNHPDRLTVWLMSNPTGTCLMCRQLAGGEDGLVAWDYHVALQCRDDTGDWIYDLDSQLPFPAPTARYLHETFPVQSRLPAHLRTTLRLIPAQDFLAYFWSDRSHMRGRIPPAAFPDYPIIAPPADKPRISLGEYRDPTCQPGDRSRVVALGDLDPLLRKV